MNNKNLQTGGVDCGVFVCLNSVLTYIGMSGYPIKEKIMKMWNWIAELLIEGCGKIEKLILVSFRIFVILY